ncbi:hypothetical protein EOG37_13920 [Clavibacter michiganensis subsp. michiganensis]|nr:hypothetical protein [Clavibacter michiganensis subsp. michiganensis]
MLALGDPAGLARLQGRGGRRRLARDGRGGERGRRAGRSVRVDGRRLARGGGLRGGGRGECRDVMALDIETGLRHGLDVGLRDRAALDVLEQRVVRDGRRDLVLGTVVGRGGGVRRALRHRDGDAERCDRGDRHGRESQARGKEPTGSWTCGHLWCLLSRGRGIPPRGNDRADGISGSGRENARQRTSDARLTTIGYSPCEGPMRCAAIPCVGSRTARSGA